MSSVRHHLRRMDIMRQPRITADDHFECGLRGALNQEEAMLQSRGIAHATPLAEVEGYGGWVGSFRHQNHRGRLARENSPVGLFWFDATLIQRGSWPWSHAPNGRAESLSASLIPNNPDNKIAKKCLAGRRPFERREMTCDTANTMLGFL